MAVVLTYLREGRYPSQQQARGDVTAPPRTNKNRQPWRPLLSSSSSTVHVHTTKCSLTRWLRHWHWHSQFWIRNWLPIGSSILTICTGLIQGSICDWGPKIRRPGYRQECVALSYCFVLFCMPAPAESGARLDAGGDNSSCLLCSGDGGVAGHLWGPGAWGSRWPGQQCMGRWGVGQIMALEVYSNSCVWEGEALVRS